MQYAPLAAPALIVLLIVNAAFYATCIALVVSGLRGLRRDRSHAVTIVLGVAPFLYYGYVYVTAYSAESDRAREVAAWPRKPVTKDNLPTTLVIEGAQRPWLARALVAAGPFERAFGDAGDTWYGYERRAGPGCPMAELPRDMASNWSQDHRCATVTKVKAPERGEPHLRLLLDLKASYHKTAHTTGVVAGSILELRWSANAGGELAAFYEKPTFHVLTFPPLVTFNGFLRSEYTPGRFDPSPDARKFVLDAVGNSR